MLPRLLTLSIVAFWLAMTTLLVRNELQPEDSRMREVPIGHVLKLVFTHEQPSELEVSSGKIVLGHLQLQPRTEKPTGDHRLDFVGSVQLRLGERTRQRVSVDGGLRLGEDYAFRRARFGVSMHAPSALRADVQIESETNLAQVTLQSSGEIPTRHTYTLDEAGGKDLLRDLGIDPAFLAVARSSQSSSAVTIQARQSSFRIHGERVDSYLVTIEQSGQTLLELQLSQLGQVLHARTLLGYTFAPRDTMP